MRNGHPNNTLWTGTGLYKSNSLHLCHLLISVSPLLTVGPSEGVPPSFGDIHTESYDQAGYKCEREEEGEPFPVASRLIDDA